MKQVCIFCGVVLGWLLLPCLAQGQIGIDPMRNVLNPVQIRITTGTASQVYYSRHMNVQYDAATHRLQLTVPLASFHLEGDSALPLDVSTWALFPPGTPAPAAGLLTLFLPMGRGQFNPDDFRSPQTRTLPGEIYLGNLPFDGPVDFKALYLSHPTGALLFDVSTTVDLRRATGATQYPDRPQRLDIFAEGGRFYDLPAE